MADNQHTNTSELICQVCGHRNLIGTLMCKNCGTMLSTENRIRQGTRHLSDDLPELQPSSVFTSGKGEFEDGMRLVLEIVGKDNKMEFDPSRRDLVVGRRDPVSRRKPDIDLEDYEGYRYGVSRRHALFTLASHQLSIQDYGSANGTFLNGVRLPAHQMHKIHDGDVLQLGHMTLRIYFAGDEEQEDRRESIQDQS